MDFKLRFKIFSRKKYEGTEGITFKSVGDLRSEIGETFLKTLKTFIETNLHNNGKKQVRHHFNLEIYFALCNAMGTWTL